MSTDVLNEYIKKLTQRAPDPALFAIEKSARERYIPLMSDECRQILGFLLQVGNVKRVLEIGTAVGYSTLFMEKTIGKEARIRSVESLEERFMEATENVKRAGADEQVELIHADALTYIPTILENPADPFGPPYDLIFLDGPKGHYLKLYEASVPFLRGGGILLADNVLFRGLVAEHIPAKHRMITIVKRMRNFLEILTADERLDTILLPIGDGISISVKKD